MNNVVALQTGTSATSLEVAEAEFQRFVAAMALDVDTSTMDEEDREEFKDKKRKIVRALMLGSLVIDEKGQPVYTPQVGDDRSPITFLEPRGSSLMAMDQRKQGHNVAKSFAVLADITKVSPQRFANMFNRDIQVCLALQALFLG
ncbi:MAG TPA: hypothetical protein VFQ61_06270 [Polyangiaceae bacterium]|nr:hypothetical protein [Polyangiaceae bacterium]